MIKNLLIKLSQALELSGNPEEAKSVREVILPVGPNQLFIGEQKNIEDYPENLGNPEAASKEYYRDLAIQAYLDLFYSNTVLLKELGMGAFSTTFLAKQNGKMVAIKFAESESEYEPYLSVKNKRESLPKNLKSILPLVFEAKPITPEEKNKILNKIFDIDPVLKKIEEYFPYRSFIVTELLVPSDITTKKLISGDPDVDITDLLIRDQEQFFNEIKVLFRQYFGSWKWFEFGKAAGKKNDKLIRYIISKDNGFQGIICANIMSEIFNLKGNDKNLIFNDDPASDGGTFIQEICDIFFRISQDNIINIVKEQIDPKDIVGIDIIKYYIPDLISPPQKSFREHLIRIISTYVSSFPQDPHIKVKNLILENFYNKLEELSEHNIQWGDIHNENVMLRPTSESHGFGELVVADVGRFQFFK